MLTTLTNEELLLLTTLTARILPSDSEPGAVEASVMNYVLWLLNHSSNRIFVRRVRSAMNLIERLAATQLGRPFIQCSCVEQELFLGQIAMERKAHIRSAFSLIVDLTLEGFLCSPVRGGNRHALGWSFVGFSDQYGICNHKA